MESEIQNLKREKAKVEGLLIEKEEQINNLEDNLEEAKIIIRNLLEEVKGYERNFKKDI